MEKQQNKQGQNFENKDQTARQGERRETREGEDISKEDVLQGMGEGVQKGKSSERREEEE